jgi:hypothetical protein
MNSPLPHLAEVHNRTGKLLRKCVFKEGVLLPTTESAGAWPKRHLIAFPTVTPCLSKSRLSRAVAECPTKGVGLCGVCGSGGNQLAIFKRLLATRGQYTSGVVGVS